MNRGKHVELAREPDDPGANVRQFSISTRGWCRRVERERAMGKCSTLSIQRACDRLYFGTAVHELIYCLGGTRRSTSVAWTTSGGLPPTACLGVSLG